MDTAVLYGLDRIGDFDQLAGGDIGVGIGARLGVFHLGPHWLPVSEAVEAGPLMDLFAAIDAIKSTCASPIFL